MSFWSSFTGSAQKKDAQQAYTASSQMLADARTKALAALQGGQQTALGNLQGGYDTARGDITGGADRARTALGTGFDTARNDLTTNYGRAEDAVTGYLDPWIGSGRRAQNLYDTALGTSDSPTAATDRANFYQTYANNDPFRAYRDEQANRQIQAQFNARGMSFTGSGRTQEAVTRASLERGTQDLNQYLDRLAQQGQLGSQYAARAADSVANIRTGLGNQLGALEQNRGTQLGNLEATTGRALGDLGYRYGADQANLNSGQGQAIANVETGYGHDTASNRVALGNSMAASRNVLTNNLLGAAGVAVRGFTPSPVPFGSQQGSTPFGTMWNAASGGWNNVSNRLWGPSNNSWGGDTSWQNGYNNFGT